MFLYGLTANGDCLCIQHSLIGPHNRHSLFIVRCELGFLYSMYTAMCHAWVSSVLEQTLSWYPKFMLICMLLLVQLSPRLTANFSPSQRHQQFVITAPSKPKTQLPPSAVYPSTSLPPSSYILNFPSCTLPPVWLDHKDERAVPCNLEQRNFLTPVHPFELLSAVPVTSSQPPPTPYTHVFSPFSWTLAFRAITAETCFRFCPVPRVFPCEYYSADAQCSSYSCCSCQKDKRAKPRYLP